MLGRRPLHNLPPGGRPGFPHSRPWDTRARARDARPPRAAAPARRTSRPAEPSRTQRPGPLTKQPEDDLERDAEPALAGIVVGVEDGVDDVEARHPERHLERRPDLLRGHPHLLLRGPHGRHEPLPHRGWAGRAGRAGQGPRRPGAGVTRRLRPALLSRLSRPPRRPLASLELEQAAAAAAAEVAAAAPGRPLGVGVSGRLRSGSSSLHRLPRPRSHHLDLARPPQLLLLLRGRKAALEVTRDREPAPLSRHNPALGTLPVLSPRTP